MEPLEVEPTGEKDHGPCACCGHNSRCVWGFVHTPAASLAAYFVHWTVGRVPDHGANFDLIIGRWGEATTSADRVLVALAYRLTDNGPAFMTIDSESRPAAENELVGRALSRAEVVGQPIAQQAFAVVDAILAQDDRISELLGPYRLT